ncbi:ABC transporter substrate-binding protein [Streptomyces canus]|uniref:ABC transporter substrate-binding protein n=1 Tax=Streptomyces canus TaxID=58343 RepID=UPI0037196755
MAGTVAGLASKVPAQYRGKTLTVGTDASVPPLEYQSSSGEIIGFEPDLVRAAAAVLGVKVKFVSAGFDSLIPGLQNGRYDMLASDMGVHPEREKVFDMVHSFQSGDSIMVRKDSTLKISGLQSVCGLSVGAQTGSTYLADLQAESSKCTAAGKKKIDLHSFSDRNAEQLALSNGRIDALVTDQGIADYAANQLHENFKVSVSYNVNPCGIGVTKDSGLAQPLKAAIQHLIDNGQYKQLVTKWHIADEAIPKAAVNGVQYQGS